MSDKSLVLQSSSGVVVPQQESSLLSASSSASPTSPERRRQEDINYVQEHQLHYYVDKWMKAVLDKKPMRPLDMFARLTLFDANKLKDEESVVCENPWCEQKVLLSEIDDHVRMCSPQRWSRCLRCNIVVDAAKSRQHRAHCRPITCSLCGEFTLPRLLNDCPRALLGANFQVSSECTGESPSTEAKVSQVQHLWRSFRLQQHFQHISFELIWQKIDEAREILVGGGSQQRRATLSKLQGPNTASMRNFTMQPFNSFTLAETQIEDLRLSEIECALYLGKLRKGQLMDEKKVEEVVERATQLLSARELVVKVARPFEGAVVVVGDLHGQLKDLNYILTKYGMPSPQLTYIFNGDFVDRGQHSTEVLLILFVLLCAYPNFVFLNRGNHEDSRVNLEYGFQSEVLAKLGSVMYARFVRSFKFMPLIHVIDDKVMVVHGGLTRHEIVLDRIKSIGHKEVIPCIEQLDMDDEILVDLLWSDPVAHFRSRTLGQRHMGSDWRTSSRGSGIEYTEALTNTFLANNGMEYVVRSHELVQGGYSEVHSGKTVTVFSASDYCGVSGNRGGVAVFTPGQLKPTFHTWLLRTSDVDVALGEDVSASVTPRDKSSTGLRDILSSHVKAKSEVLDFLQEQIWNRRHELMSQFAFLDMEQTGFVSKTEWCVAMRKVIGIDLPYYFLCPFVADLEMIDELWSVRYAVFLSSLDSKCGQRWLNQYVTLQAKKILGDMDLPQDLMSVGGSAAVATSPGGSNPAAHLINYEMFCSAVRANGKHTNDLSDNDMFVIFMYFDGNRDGQVDPEDVAAMVELMESDDEEEELNRTTSAEWKYPVMMQLQQLFTFGKSRGLKRTFQILDRDGSGELDKEEFARALKVVSANFSRPISPEEMDQVFSTIDQNQSGTVDYEEFVSYFCVMDMRKDASIRRITGR